MIGLNIYIKDKELITQANDFIQMQKFCLLNNSDCMSSAYIQEFVNGILTESQIVDISILWEINI